jgi:diguanylate cyclase (GGDEF)-like protein/PAS domain S-box-containing protein
MVAPSANALLALLDRAVDVIAVVDREGRILYVNSTVSDVLAWPREELLGTPALDLIHPDDFDLAAAALAAELAGGPVTPVEVRVRHQAGHFLWFEVLANGWLDESGVTGLVLNLRESTGRHELAVVAAQRAALDGLVSVVSRRALDATLADITKALPGILAELGALLGAGRAHVVLFDTSRGVATDTACWTAGEADGHVPRVIRSLNELSIVLERLSAGEPLVEDDLARDRPEWAKEWYGEARPVGACVLCPKVVGGRLLGVLAIDDPAPREWLRDEVIAVRSVAEALAVALVRDLDRRALVASEEQFRLIAENASDVITLLDETGLCRYVSSSARSVLGVEPAALDGTNLFDHVHEDDRAAARERLAAFAASDEDMVSINYRWRRPSGEIVWIENVVRAVRDPETGALAGLEGSARDVTARKVREDELSHRALHDPLTGVANRTLFVERLTGALRNRRQSDQPLAVLAIDLDGFKEVNDAYGHLEGDRALITVAHRLTSAVRQSDTVGRFGGDEFLVLCLDTTADDAVALARRLVASVAEPLAIDRGTTTIGASVGVAPADRGDPSIDHLLGAADQAMYEAKRAGKRGVRLRRPG